MEEWSYTTDIIVAGSGGGGMTAALMAHDMGKEVLLLEKGDVYGGTTAMSGGGIWIPNNHLMHKEGIEDSEDDAFAYMKKATKGMVPDEMLRAYIKKGAEMVSYLEKHSHAKFQTLSEYPDYYPDEEGAKPGGRTIEPLPIRGEKLHSELDNLEFQHPTTTMPIIDINTTSAEARKALPGGIEGNLVGAWWIIRYLSDIPARLRYGFKRDLRLTLGNGLIARLRLSLMDRNVPLWLGTRVQKLITENGEVIGIEATRHGKPLRIRARKGVILACGGFAHSSLLRKKYQKQPITTEWTAATPNDTGDGIFMGRSVGAKLGLMEEAWWAPTTVVPGGKFPFLAVIEKGLPGCMLVNDRGRRFTNEAAPYIDVGRDMYKPDKEGENNIPAYLIMDKEFRTKYPCGPLLPMFAQPEWMWSKTIKEEWMIKADSIQALAQKAGIDSDGLEGTLKSFNENAAQGIDPEFKRGYNIYDRYYSDPAVKPNPCLRPLKGPFYAIPIYPGDLGTKGGLVTDETARVMNQDGDIIPGLYAVGNCASSMMGDTYPGAGSTIGPSMVFGYIAAMHAARVEKKVAQQRAA